MERRAGEHRRQPGRRAQSALGGQASQVRVNLDKFRSPGVRGRRNGESPRLLLQHFGIAAERLVDQAVVGVALGSGAGQLAEIERGRIVGQRRAVGSLDRLMRAGIAAEAVLVAPVVVGPAAGEHQ